MINKFLVFFFVVTFSYQTFACNYKLKVNSQFDDEAISILIDNFLKEKNYKLSDKPDVLVNVKFSKRVDHHQNEYYAHSSLTSRNAIDGSMLNYVHGQGDYYDVASEAYSLSNFLTSIKRAIKHLPICN